MTQHYVGTKIVEAWLQERDGVPGYAVKYADGYTSWSPKGTFEAAYIALGHIGRLPSHVQRMYAESAELNGRLIKLNAFLESEMFLALAKDDRDLLKAQGGAMTAYWNALETRINRANPVPTAQG
jgi:branched-subunit amino acid aminotransferase/4-amino-4-deoxychorismate lyase